MEQRIIGILLAAVLSGCALLDENWECSPGQELKDTLCVVIPDASADSGDDGDATTEGAAGGGTGEFGRTCTSDTECDEPAPFCAIKPGDPDGYCTVTGCLADPAVCPSGYSCMDLTAFGVPDFCSLN